MIKQFPAFCGISMLLIVLNHTIDLAINFPPGYGDPGVNRGLWIMLSLLQTLGHFAVPIFLFISGVFISYALQSKRAESAYRVIIRSLSRICWPYLLWSTVFYALVIPQLGKEYELQEYAKNLLVGYPYHFIPLLMFFYAISPFLVRLSRRHSMLLIVGIAVYQLCLLSLSVTDGMQPWMRIISPPVIRTTLAKWAVFFPLGLVFGMHVGSLLPAFQKIKGMLIFLTVGFFLLDTLQYHFSPYLSICGYLSSAAAVLLMTLVERKSIPKLDFLESIGKRSYGLYLSNLIVLDLILFAISKIQPGLFEYRVAFIPLLFVIAILLPMSVMKTLAKSPGRGIYRYIFG